ncbi:MAG: glycosyltransferase family 4 protein [Acidobacteriota bacterium]|nr:glycosyltransferase family 4 protein [Acidobacteriota bacterium]
MKILVTANYYPEKVGGIEIVVHNLVSRFRKAAHDVRWVASDVHDRRRIPRAGDYPIKAWNFTEKRLGFPYPVPRPAALAATVEHVKWADVVHIHDCLYLHNQYIFWQAKRLHKPVILTQHIGTVPYPQFYKGVLQKVAYHTIGKAVLGRADQVVFVSEAVKAWFDSFVKFRRPPAVFPNGVDPAIFGHENRDEHQPPGNSPSLLFVGRFTQKKGLTLIREVAAARPAWAWTLVGTAADINPADWHLDNVTVLPTCTQPELRKLYRAADLLALPSVGEGFPLVVAEAMGCGTPVLIGPDTAAALPGLKDCVAVAELTPSGILETIEGIVSDRVGSAKLSAAGRSFATRYLNWDTASDNYLRLFESILTERNTSQQSM